MRIISGSCRGRKLVPVEGQGVRPTSDRAREAVFNMLGPRVKNSRVLDLFAGTGALGLEALSRGADHAVFMDLSCDLVQKNLQLCRLVDSATVYTLDIVTNPLPEYLFNGCFDIVFIDPPYGKGYIEQVCQKDKFLDLLCPEALIIAEHSHKENPVISASGLDFLKQKKYSKTKISIMHKT